MSRCPKGGRYRLTSATLGDNTKTRWKETYTYDVGDNLVTKNAPWFDTFNDGALDEWTVCSGTWSAANGYLDLTTAGDGRLHRTDQVPLNYELWYSYEMGDTSDTSYYSRTTLRYQWATPYDQVVVFIQNFRDTVLNYLLSGTH